MNQKVVWVEKEEEITLAATDYFSGFFTSSSTSSVYEVLRDVPKLILADMSTHLLSEIIEEKVKKAVTQMNPEKTPGSNELTTLFHQKIWDIIGSDLVALVR